MKILIADDHSVVRRGLKTILVDEFPHATIGEAQDGAELLQKASSNDWDIIVSDISMPGRSGMEILKELKEVAPKIPVLILSVHSPEQYAVRTIKAGAAGYLTKESAPDELVKIVRHIVSGRKYITPEIAEMLAESYNDSNKPPHENLSDREFEVMKLIASGKTVSEIADILSLSVNTISTYRSRILEKMRMGTNAELTHYTISNKLVWGNPMPIKLSIHNAVVVAINTLLVGNCIYSALKSGSDKQEPVSFILYLSLILVNLFVSFLLWRCQLPHAKIYQQAAKWLFLLLVAAFVIFYFA